MKIIKIALFTICALSAYAPEALGGVLLDLVKTNKIEKVREYLQEYLEKQVDLSESFFFYAAFSNFFLKPYSIDEDNNKEEMSRSFRFACRNNNPEIVKLLLKNGAKDSVNKASTKHGKTPLYWACWNNNLEIVKLLLDNGAKESVNKANAYGKTPFYWACWENNPEVIKLLLENGAKDSVNKVDNYGESPLYWVCYKDNLEMVKLLLDNGAKDSVNKAGNDGRTPLYWACHNNNLEIVKLLLDNGAKESVNRVDDEGYTPLYCACLKNNPEIVKLLLENGAKESVNKAGNDGRTPLYWACWRNNLEMVKLLLENGADATTGVSGKKAIERICSSKWTTENRKKLLMSLLSIPEKGDENETEEQKNSRIFKELVVSSLAENMQQSSTIAPTIPSNDGLRKYTGIANPEQVINQIETVVKFYLFTPFATVAKKSAHLWPVVIGSNSSSGIQKLIFRLSLRQLKAEFGLTYDNVQFLRNLQKSAQEVYVKMGGKIVIPAKTMRKLCDLWFKFEYNNQ